MSVAKKNCHKSSKKSATIFSQISDRVVTGVSNRSPFLPPLVSSTLHQ